MAILSVSWTGGDWASTVRRPGRYWESSADAYRRVGQGHWLDAKNRWHTCYNVQMGAFERLLVDYEECEACQRRKGENNE